MFDTCSCAGFLLNDGSIAIQGNMKAKFHYRLILCAPFPAIHRLILLTLNRLNQNAEFL